MVIFFYGSNMLSERLKQRISSARNIGIGKLYEHSLKFRKVGMDDSGKCDIQFTGKKKDQVWGLVVEIDPSEKHILDKFEDYGKGYTDKVVEIELESGLKLSALTYFALKINPDLKPYDWYKDYVVVGAIKNRLPGSYIQYLQKVKSIQDPDLERISFNRRILYNF